KLLRFIEEQKIRRLGSNQMVKVDVRLIAASNRNLQDLVVEGKFRQDLYYRLRVIELDLPPLRERTEDIPLLVDYFLKRFGRERGCNYDTSAKALSALVSYAWPGNVRELENALEAAVALNRTGMITPEDLPAKIGAQPNSEPRPEELFSDLPSLEELERRYVEHLMKVTGGNKAKTAGILGIDRRTIYRMEEKFKEEKNREQSSRGLERRAGADM